MSALTALTAKARGAFSKLAYLCRSFANSYRPARFRCPDCGASGGSVVDRKFLVTKLIRCPGCSPLSRRPTDPPGFADRPYRAAYRQSGVTDLPSPNELAEMLQTGFRDTPFCLESKIRVLQRLGAAPRARVFDFGCSWGYGTWQLQRAGFDAFGYEVNPVMSVFARNELGLQTIPLVRDSS